MGPLLVLILLVLRLNLVSPQIKTDALPLVDEFAVEYLVFNSADLIHHTSLEVWRLDILRQSFRGSAAYEIGFLVRTTENSADLIHHTSLEVWRLDILRQSFRGSAAYEIGFLVRTTEERYRKMVDLYNTSVTMDNKLRTREHILYLQKIEKLHWDITHLANMLHEVERKYKIAPQALDKRDDFLPWGYKDTTTQAPVKSNTTQAPGEAETTQADTGTT